MTNETNTDKQAEIDRCALAYQKLTGFFLPHRGVFDHRARAWYDWLKAGFTVHDLECVILHLKRGIREERRNPGCLRFSNLIERIDLFGEELCMAKAEQRNRKPAPTPKEQALQQWRPKVGEPAVKDTAVPASAVLAGTEVSEFMKGIAAMREACK